jgi:AraC-like DNA-binding protein
VELDVPAEGMRWTVPEAAGVGGAHLLILDVEGTLELTHGSMAWTQRAGEYVWLSLIDSVRFRLIGKGRGVALLWSFTAGAVPGEMRPLLPVPGHAPAFGPAQLTPSMQTVLLALRGCPVAPALRNLWGTGKLIELLTLLLPPPVAREAGEAGEAGVLFSSRVQHPAIRAALDCMAARLGDPIGLPEIASAANSSPSHLSRLFTAEFGHGPTEHLRRLRLDHAAALLRSGRANVTEAAYAAGYQSLGQFSRAFSVRHGKPPSAFIRRG